MAEPNETPSTNAIVTATGTMNILRKDEDESLAEALERELAEELTPERAMSFLKDAGFEVEPLEESGIDVHPPNNGNG